MHRALGFMLGLTVAAFGLRAQAQDEAPACRPTARIEVVFLPHDPAPVIEQTLSLADVIVAANMVMGRNPLVSPNLGFVQFPSIAARLDQGQRGRDGPACPTVARIEVSLGFAMRNLLLSREIAGDECLNAWVHDELARLDSWEDAMLAELGSRIGAPLQERLRAMTWAGLAAAPDGEAVITELISQSVFAAMHSAMAALQLGRDQHFADMQARLEGACGGRGAAVLNAVNARPL